LAAPQSFEMAQRAVATRRSQSYDGYAKRKDNSYFRTEVRGRTVHLREGVVRATVLRAVTDEDEFERERLRAISLLRTTVESTADGLLVVDRGGRLVLHNKRFWSMWSIPDDVMERGLDEQIVACIERQLVHPEAFRSRVDALYGAPELEGTDVLELLDGRTIERYSGPQYAGDEIIGRVWSFRDITAHQRASHELAASVKMRDEFISVASHELFTPITSLVLAIRGLTELYHRSGAATDPGTRLLRGAERQIKRLSRLVRELLDVTQLEVRSLTLNLEQIDLCEVTREVVEQLGPELERDGVVVRVSTSPRVVGWWDGSRLEQVLTNLITNAIKFGQGRPIEINVRGAASSAIVEVVDHGIGIAPEQQRSIFERFQRAVSSQHFAGLGLGLFICRQIVEGHGGALSVESALGVGSTFRIELPLTPRPGSGTEA
jgi:signal transduction histidine kinase